MKPLLKSIILLLAVNTSFGFTSVLAQGMSSKDIEINNPAFFKTFSDDYKVKPLSLNVNTKQGSIPVGKLCEANNGKLYGMTMWGGAHDKGVLYEWDPITCIYTKKMDFNGSDNGSHPQGSLTLADNGKLYGMTEYGGVNDEGVLFEWDADNDTYTKKIDLSRYESGRFPYESNLMQADNGKLYGMTRMGGSNDLGVLFEWDPITNILTKKVDFNGTDNGSGPRGTMIQADNGKLYGMTCDGGANEYGVLFEWDPVNNIFIKKLDFDSETGGAPTGSLMQVANGKFYGATANSDKNCGIIFEWSLSENIFKCIHKYIYQDGCWLFGCSPLSSFVKTDNKIYWITRGGGCSSGILFEYNPTSEIYRNIFMFKPLEGAIPTSLMQATNGKIYLTTENGLSSEGGERFETGAIYEYDPILDICEKKFGFNMANDPSINLSEGLVAYYPFNGNANDESGNGYNGVVQGASLAYDRYGNNHSSFLFDTNNATIQLPNDVLNDLPNASISLWVYWKGERPSIIMAKQHDWVDSYYIFGIGMYNIGGGVDIGDTGRIYFRVKNSSQTLISNSLLESNKWNHLVITIDRDLKLYINGILDAEISSSDFVLPDDLNATLTSLGLWLQDVRYSGVMNGNLDDIRFYNRALNDLEIQALYNENKAVIYTPELNVYKNSSFKIPINAYSLISINNAVSYQFDFSYDSQKLQFLNYDIESTLSENGSVQVNPLDNKLTVAWAGQTPLADSGIILKLRFKALETGITTPVLSKFLINTDTIKDITNGTITINPTFGDVDDNGSVQAFDAALTLQYSVGLDPMPYKDPLPWEDWRIATANVDGQDAISAYDASLILQYTVGLINSFPVLGYKKSTYTLQADITVSVEDGTVIFRSSGDLYGLNLSLVGNDEVLGAPQVINSNMLVATNISSSFYSVGLATAYPPSENEIILKIPLIETITQPISIDMKIDNRPKQIELGVPTAIADPLSSNIEMYPNPANTILYFKNLVGEASIYIYDLHGRKIITRTITNNQVDIGNLDHGLYTIRIENSENTIIRKFIKL